MCIRVPHVTNLDDIVCMLIVCWATITVLLLHIFNLFVRSWLYLYYSTHIPEATDMMALSVCTHICKFLECTMMAYSVAVQGLFHKLVNERVDT